MTTSTFTDDRFFGNLSESAFRSSRNINEIILHCSATKEGQDFTAADIRRWHLQRGFADIGYHFVVRLDGTIEQGRDINRIGAHCLNHNQRSIGICYIGGLDKLGKPADTRTDSQHLALPALIRRLRRNHPKARIHGHREFAAKACPCFDAAEYANI
jgi:N-acetylmuramoyl-L-alanine amidase